MGQETLVQQEQHTESIKCEESPSHSQQHVQNDAITEFDLDRLGRQRPAVFKNTFEELMFCGSILISMFMSVSTTLHLQRTIVHVLTYHII